MNKDYVHKKEDDKKIYKIWEKAGLFKPQPSSIKKPYSLLMPPPNLTGELHLGHAMQHAILDAIARFKRLQGYDVLLLPGVDHAGIQFEGTLNKLLAKEGLSKEKLGREKWLRRAWKFKEEVYKSFRDTWTVLGISADWSREVFTLGPKVEKAVFEQFKTFWDQSLLYKGAYIVQWCPKCGTAIEDIEMEYEERKEKLYFVKYKIKNSDKEYITVATARPETIFADVGIAIHPNHPKYKKYIGQTALNPLTKTVLPIFEDKRVERDFGTGALKITPGHDPLDYEIGKDNNLEILHAIDKTGKMTVLAGDLNGLSVNQAREKVVETLSTPGALEETEDYTHSVPVCERCKTRIEPLISEEWFVKMDPIAKKALMGIGKIHFAPKNYKRILSDWIKNIHDWSISRSLWWGHRIPVWYCQNCNPNHEVGKDKDMIVSLNLPKKSCQTCGKKNWQQDEQVLDTWFSSGLWPLSTLGWPTKTKEAQRYFPWSFEITSPQIKYLWIARMIILSIWHTGKVPFKNMFFHGELRDLQGRRFSKSLGNGIDPKDLVEVWGTDATRGALYTYSAPGRDGKTSRSVMDNRCKNFRNFANKIKNITKFVIDLKPKGSEIKISGIELSSTHKDDKWIIRELEKTTQEITINIEKFRLHLAIDRLYNFVWHKFADIYIERSKKRRREAQPCLEYVLDCSLRLLHPFMPFITEQLWKATGKKGSIMLSKWPL